MTPTSVAQQLRLGKRDIRPFTAAGLSQFFGVPAKHFHQTEPDGPIQFHPAGDPSPAAQLLRGAIFWPGDSDQLIVRGHPRIFPTSDYTNERLQVLSEPLLASSAAEGSELTVESKPHGVTVRVYTHDRELYAATDVAHDGGNPLVGAGIDNSRALGIDYGSQAARIVAARYPKVERLAMLGYVAVFVLQLPELAPDQSVDRSDLVLVDVIDPDCVFVDRLEKERIAEDYSLTVVDLVSRIALSTADPAALVRRLRALEHQPVQPGSSGVVVKGRIDDSADQLFCKVEPASERDRARELSGSDLAAVTEEMTGQFGEGVWTDELFSEELMLEYIATHHRSARWRVSQYLTAWRNARRAAGLG